MNRTNTLHNLNNTDAVLFVYDKTLSEIYANTGEGNGGSHEQNMFTNIVSLNHPEIREQNWKTILENVSEIVKIILWIDNDHMTYLEMLNLTHEYLPKYMNLYSENRSSPPEIMRLLSTIQDKIIMTHSEYVEFLEIFYKVYKKNGNKLNKENVFDKCLLISVHFSGKNIPEILASEYSKNEGWKTFADFIRWLV
jgi:hypothetical protein